MLQLSPLSKTFDNFHMNVVWISLKYTEKKNNIIASRWPYTVLIYLNAQFGYIKRAIVVDNKVSNNVNKMFTWIFDNCKWSIRMPIIIDAKCDQSTGLLFLFCSFYFDSFFKENLKSFIVDRDPLQYFYDTWYY